MRLQVRICKTVCAKHYEHEVQVTLSYRREPRRHFLRHVIDQVDNFVYLESLVDDAIFTLSK